MAAVATRSVLGVWDGHDAGAALLVDNQLVCAISEERLSRKKRAAGFPYASIETCLGAGGLSPCDVEAVAVPGQFGRLLHRAADSLYRRGDGDRDPLGAASTAIRVMETGVARLAGIRGLESMASRAVLSRRLADLGISAEITSVDHHDCHAWTAASVADPEALVVTMDGYGDGLCATFNGPGAGREGLASPGWSLALVYGAVTRLLGFGEGDEGKVMGLAASGDPEILSDWAATVMRDGGCDPRLGGRAARARLLEHRREDVAAALQSRVESLATTWIEARRGRRSNLALAGGLFANVALNGALAERFDGVSVFPHMGDGGLALGAALHLVGGLDLREIPCWGPRYADVEAEIKTKKGILVEPMDHPEDHLLRTIEHGGIVGRWLGRSEFGPRALGHRSILLRADDQSLVDTLNARLKREEFMPFAPIRRAGAGSSTMTVVVPADDELRDRCPAAVHRDGTVRTQLINAEFDPGLWRLLARAEEAGLPALINTSFNRHGEPIVERPSEAVELLRLGVVDVLQCDKFLVRRV